jgi:hypothetical protein
MSDARADENTSSFLGALVKHGGQNRWHICGTARWLDTNGEVETEESPIPAPRTRLPTRWNGSYERWEKLTQHGWVSAF